MHYKIERNIEEGNEELHKRFAEGVYSGGARHSVMEEIGERRVEKEP